jgi:hypothetical protein
MFVGICSALSGSRLVPGRELEPSVGTGQPGPDSPYLAPVSRLRQDDKLHLKVDRNVFESCQGAC